MTGVLDEAETYAKYKALYQKALSKSLICISVHLMNIKPVISKWDGISVINQTNQSPLMQPVDTQ